MLNEIFDGMDATINGFSLQFGISPISIIEYLKHFSGGTRKRLPGRRVILSDMRILSPVFCLNATPEILKLRFPCAGLPTLLCAQWRETGAYLLFAKVFCKVTVCIAHGDAA